MNPLKTSKLSSMISTLTACATLALGSTGCLVSGSLDLDTTDVVVVETPDVSDATVAELAIDSGATISATPGDGLGVFLQYEEGGFWTLYTTCDTAISGASCSFDILAYAVDSSVRIDNVQGFDLADDDVFALNDDGSINLVTETSYGKNGFIFDAEPGATIELDILIDGVAQPRFVFAVSDGVVLEGVPTNPVDFAPSHP